MLWGITRRGGAQWPSGKIKKTLFLYAQVFGKWISHQHLLRKKKEKNVACNVNAKCGWRGYFFRTLKSPRYLEIIAWARKNNIAHVFLLKRRKNVYFKLLFATQTLLQTTDNQKLQRNIEESLADWLVRVRKLTICEIWGPLLPVATAAASSDEDEATQWK